MTETKVPEPEVEHSVSAAAGAQEFVNEAIQPTPQPQPLGKKKFLPWHRPRKHYIRIKQWCASTEKLVKNLRLADKDRPLRYLGLPGDDMLDLRALQGVCANEKVKLSVCGVNSISANATRKFEIDISESELKQQPGIDSLRFVVVDAPFEGLTQGASVLRREVEKRIPFDVVNIDLCDSAFDDPPLTDGSTLHALHELVKLQLASSATPWLLFLTSRIGKGAKVDADTQKRLFGVVDANLAGVGFAQDFQEVFGVSKTTAPVVSQIDQSILPEFYGLALSKWLLAIVHPHKWRVDLVSYMGYHVDSSESIDMISFALRFEREAPDVADPAGLTPAGAVVSKTVPEVHESEGARALIKQAKQLVDVDRLFVTDKDVADSFKKKNRTFLEAARFDVDDYDKWLAENEKPGTFFRAFLEELVRQGVPVVLSSGLKLAFKLVAGDKYEFVEEAIEDAVNEVQKAG